MSRKPVMGILAAACTVSLVACSDNSLEDTQPQFTESSQTKAEATPAPSEASSSSETTSEEAPSSAETSTEQAADTEATTDIPEDVRAKLLNASLPENPGTFLPDGATLVNGRAELEMGGFAEVVQDKPIWKAQLNDDPSAEYVVPIMLSGGGSGWVQTYYVMDENGTVKGRMDPVPSMQIQRGGYDITAIHGKEIDATWIAFQDSDPLCCGSLQGTGTFEWDGADSLVTYHNPVLTQK